LFEKDKLLFSFSLASKLKLDQGLISQQELRFLMTGKLGVAVQPCCLLRCTALHSSSATRSQPQA
jgi:hypothetical protein